MPAFGKSSLSQRATIHPRLQLVLDEAIKSVDFTILEGHRGEAAQNAAFAAGLSKLKYPFGNHNAVPSKAADIAPYPIDWTDKATALGRFYFLMGVCKACADRLGVKVRFGFDWNRNLDPRDESFIDLDHIELDE